MGVDLTLFTGGATSFSIDRLLSNLGWMLSSDFDLTLVSTVPNTFDDVTLDRYNIVGEEYPSTTRGSVWALSAALSERPRALVQLTRPSDHGPLAGAVASAHGVPFVYRYSGDHFREYKVMDGWRKAGYFFRNNVVGRLPLLLSDEFVVLGAVGRQRLLSRGIDEDRLVQLPPTVDPSRFSGTFKRPLAFPTNRSVVLSVGRIDRLKGFDLFREAIPAILDRRDDLQFIFVGPQQESFEVPHRHEDRVTLIGAVPPAEIPKYFSAADLYLHPSRTEGLPRVLLEALFAGTPVLATSVGEIPSVTDNTFETTEELVEAVVTFESLRVDDSSVYSRERRQEDFIQFFSSI